MSVENVASQSSVVFEIQYTACLKKHNFWGSFHVSPGIAETLVMRGGTTNHHLIAYSLSNISAKNHQNRLMCVEVIMCNISVVFETQCTDVQCWYNVGLSSGDSLGYHEWAELCGHSRQRNCTRGSDLEQCEGHDVESRDCGSDDVSEWRCLVFRSTVFYVSLTSLSDKTRAEHW